MTATKAKRVKAEYKWTIYHKNNGKIWLNHLFGAHVDVVAYLYGEKYADHILQYLDIRRVRIIPVPKFQPKRKEKKR